MAILYRHHAKGMDPATYDQASQHLLPRLKEQPGFLYHVAFGASEGMVVSEIWESREQHDRWFNEQVKPNIPSQITVEEIEVHNIVTP